MMRDGTRFRLLAEGRKGCKGSDEDEARQFRSRGHEMVETKILAIDNDVEFLEDLEKMLNLGGYDPITTNDSTTALNIALEAKPDVILTGIKMKGLSGFQVADRLNQHVETADIPVIAMSGHSIKKEHNRLMQMLGIKALIKKPFNPLDVISCIEMVSKKYSKLNGRTNLWQKKITNLQAA